MELLFIFAGPPDLKKEKILMSRLPEFSGKIFFVGKTLGFNPPSLHGEKLKQMLLDHGVKEDQIVILPGYGSSSASEIDTAEVFIKKQTETVRVIVANSWYLLPRVLLLWLVRHKRLVTIYPIVEFNLVNFLLEPVKLPFSFLPLKAQGCLDTLLTKAYLKLTRTKRR